MRILLLIMLIVGSLESVHAGPYDKAAIAYARKLGLDLSNPKVKELIVKAAGLKDTLLIAAFIEEEHPYTSIADSTIPSSQAYEYKFRRGNKITPTAGIQKVTLEDFISPEGVLCSVVKNIIQALNDPSSTYKELTEEEIKSKDITDPYEEGLIPYTIRASTGDTRTAVYTAFENIQRHILGKMVTKNLSEIRELNKAIIENAPKDLEYFAFRVRMSHKPTEETIDVPSYYLG